MSDSIIPGIDDARARELLSSINRHGELQFEETRVTFSELRALRAAHIVSQSRTVYALSITGRALWERINNDDKP